MAVARDQVKASPRFLQRKAQPSWFTEGTRRGRGVAAEINADSGRADFTLGDIARDADVAGVFEKARNFLGSIDIFVNNAGVGFDVRGWDDLGPVEWAAMLRPLSMEASPSTLSSRA